MSRVYGINKGHHITKSLATWGVDECHALSVSALATVGRALRYWAMIKGAKYGLTPL